MKAPDDNDNQLFEETSEGFQCFWCPDAFYEHRKDIFLHIKESHVSMSGIEESTTEVNRKSVTEEVEVNLEQSEKSFDHESDTEKIVKLETENEINVLSEQTISVYENKNSSDEEIHVSKSEIEAIKTEANKKCITEDIEVTLEPLKKSFDYESETFQQSQNFSIENDPLDIHHPRFDKEKDANSEIVSKCL